MVLLRIKCYLHDPNQSTKNYNWGNIVPLTLIVDMNWCTITCGVNWVECWEQPQRLRTVPCRRERTDQCFLCRDVSLCLRKVNKWTTNLQHYSLSSNGQMCTFFYHGRIMWIQYKPDVWFPHPTYEKTFIVKVSISLLAKLLWTKTCDCKGKFESNF